MKEQSFIAALGAVALPVFEYFYGAGEAVKTIMVALLFFLVMDWVSGIRASKKDKTYASEYGIDGAFRSFFILLLPAGGHMLDLVFHTPGPFFGALAIGVLYHTVQSMTANAVRAGWGSRLPIWILDGIIKWVRSELEKKILRAESRKDVPTSVPDQNL